MTDLNIGERGEKLYLPYPVAEREGLVGDAQVLRTPPGVLFSSGILPGASNGGALEIGGQVWGIDHLASSPHELGIKLSGTDKTAIHRRTPEMRRRNIGTIEEEGVITMTNLEESKVIIGAIVKQYTPWIKDQYKRQGLTCYVVGGMAIGIPILGSELAMPLDLIQTRAEDLIVRPKLFKN